MTKRCAIYTRKSTEEGLDQAFNSLDAQREACEAYIASQRHEGWKLVKTRFDDGGLSGGNMERPALQSLLAEIDAGHIDLIVVYKVDRLTRSLADFAKLVERFDAQDVSFVSVTQQFNTSSSMGRLTLNVLLSFAQFEREVTAERIRDKIAASRRKGMWTGGNPPLGYDNVNKQLVINESEAKTVERLFELYLETSCIRSVINAATDEQLTTKHRANGRGGKPLTRGPLYHILANPIYVGLVRSGKDLHQGMHQAIIEKQTWDAVQHKRRDASQRQGTKTKSSNPLVGKLFADAHRLTPSHASKDGKRYRYYVSHAFETGKTAAGQRWRINAETLEATVLKAIDHWMRTPNAVQSLLTNDARAKDLQSMQLKLTALCAEENAISKPQRLALWATRINRIDLDETSLAIVFTPKSLFHDGAKLHLASKCKIQSNLAIGKRGVGLRLIIGDTETAREPTDSALGMIKDAFTWRERWFNDPGMTLSDVAKEADADLGDVSKQMRLAFLAPDIVTALLNGTAPEELKPKRLRRIAHLPASWSAQRRLLGLIQN